MKTTIVNTTPLASSTFDLSIVIPARDEAEGLTSILPALQQHIPHAEVIVIDDGSNDDTAAVAAKHGARVVRHPYSLGNGAAIKSGARAARGATLVFMDADGQHDPSDIPRLLAAMDQGHDMVVGARDSASQANIGRSIANGFYNRFASWVVGHRIADLTSGFRAVHATKFREFLHLLPNGFSYPTTITMSFFRSGYAVTYVPVRVHRCKGKSHINPLQDGIRFLLIMIRIGTLYAPLKIFLPISLGTCLIGIGYYLYTFTMSGRFTNMSGLLMTSSLIMFLIGLVSEQITMLLYKKERE